MPTVLPFPLITLARVPRSDVLLRRRLARALEGLPVGAALAPLEPLLGAIELTPAAIERWPAGAMAAREEVPIVAIVVGDAMAGPGPRLVVELDADLAGHLVERALGAPDGAVRLVAGPASDGERGVLAYLAARALVATGGRLRAIGVVTAVSALRHALGDGALAAWPIQITAGRAGGWARLWIPDGWSPPNERPPSGPGAGPMEITLSIVAGEVHLRAGDLRSLEVGDAIVPDSISISRTPHEGDVALVSPHGGPTFRARLRADGALVLGSCVRGSLLPTPTARGTVAADMAEPYGDAVTEVPVELRLEVGRVILRVSELAAMRPGEILTTGTPVGTRVTLRAGDDVVAIGELCDVEGELGVRILDLPRRP